MEKKYKTISAIVIALIFTAFFTLVYLNSIDQQNKIYEQKVSSCTEICESNGMNYYKGTDSGFARSVHTCYCKTIEGNIKTFVM